MRRRALLAGLGAGAAGLAGCSALVQSPPDRPPTLDYGFETTRPLESPHLRDGLRPPDDRLFHAELIAPSTDSERLTDAGREEGSYASLSNLAEGTFVVAVETRTSVADPYGLSAATRDVRWTGSRSLRLEPERTEDLPLPDDADESAGLVAVSAARYEHDRDGEPESVTVVLPGGAEHVVEAAP